MEPERFSSWFAADQDAEASAIVAAKVAQQAKGSWQDVLDSGKAEAGKAAGTAAAEMAAATPASNGRAAAGQVAASKAARCGNEEKGALRFRVARCRHEGPNAVQGGTTSGGASRLAGAASDKAAAEDAAAEGAAAKRAEAKKEAA